MELRERLRRHSGEYFAVFSDLTSRLTPLLASIEQQFPEYTRHDPSHNGRLEVIAADLLKPEIKDALTAADLFTLLCALWLHDAGMGICPRIETLERAKAPFREKLARFERLGRSETDCWREYVRENHHRFCVDLTRDYLGGRTSEFIQHWIGAIGESHGERQIHDRSRWPRRIAVSDTEHIHPPVLAATVRLADILHFSYDRAPDYMLEHRHIESMLSIAHWRAHQVAAGYTIDNDICYFDGVTTDDEAYWFAQQFFDAMEAEVRYCKADVFPTLDGFASPLTFSRIERRIEPSGFSPESTPVALRIDTPTLLGSLLNDALYAGKPAWFRELLQNGFDACRDRAVHETGSECSVAITVATQPEKITFADTGIGMRRRTVENFLLVAGASYWSSAEYRAERIPSAGHVGRFGVGFMSVFAVAQEVTVETRHVSEPSGWRFVIRSPRQVVRVEPRDRPSPGTTVTLTLKPGTFLLRDPLDLLSEVCTYPEFPLTLVVDGNVERSYPTGLSPVTSDEGFALWRSEHATVDAKLVSREIHEDGVCGAFQMPKLLSRQLRAFVPDMRGWLRKGGWDIKGESRTYYGGVNYPPLHAVSAPVGFTHVPSIGVLRVAVSPNRYPLEMNLARDNFVAGEGTYALFRTIARLLDGFFAEDLAEELESHPDLVERSAIAGFYSWTLLHLWTGHVPSLSAVALSRPSTESQLVGPTPWPRLTRAMEQALMFRTLDRSLDVRNETLASLLDSGAIVFAAGSRGRGISRPLQQAIFEFAPDAKLLLGLPDPRFGIIELRHWAREEYLVPVLEHGRCAFGLRLGRETLPFAFFPRETERFGIPLASGPEQFALLDYRDLMAEATMQPTGGPTIVAVLNRRNQKIMRLLATLATFPDYNALRRELGNTFKDLTSAITIGQSNRYIGQIGALIANLNAIAAALDAQMPPIVAGDVPQYMTGGTVTPFGRPLVDQLTMHALQEIERYDVGTIELA